MLNETELEGDKLDDGLIDKLVELEGLRLELGLILVEGLLPALGETLEDGLIELEELIEAL
jgi:hypothetical protein